MKKCTLQNQKNSNEHISAICLKNTDSMIENYYGKGKTSRIEDGYPRNLKLFFKTVTEGNVKNMLELISVGVKPNSVEDGVSALYIAAWKGYTDIVNILLQTEKKFGYSFNKRDPFLGACKNGHTDIVSCLINRGVHINSEDENGLTGLHYAAACGHIDVIKTLLDAKADITYEDEDGWTLLHYAVYNNQIDVIRELLSHGTHGIKKIVNIKDIFGRTALFIASERGHLKIVKDLLRYGVEVDEQDNLGKTALYVAAENGQKEVFVELINAGADVNKKTNGKRSILQLIVSRGHNDLIDKLLSRIEELDVNERNCYGETPLMIAAFCGHQEIVLKLLSHGAKFNLEDIDGQTCLQKAVLNNHEEVVKVLLETFSDTAKVDYSS